MTDAEKAAELLMQFLEVVTGHSWREPLKKPKEEVDEQ